jgi:hypothetical protein
MSNVYGLAGIYNCCFIHTFSLTESMLIVYELSNRAPATNNISVVPRYIKLTTKNTF